MCKKAASNNNIWSEVGKNLRNSQKGLYYSTVLEIENQKYPKIYPHCLQWQKKVINTLNGLLEHDTSVDKDCIFISEIILC